MPIAGYVTEELKIPTTTRSAVNRHGNVREFHIVWRVVTLDNTVL